ncbi:translation initiation factor IF-2 associated domain-containing protein, partial [Luteimonas sp. 8-5]|uniref:translation initiation factor IF-2 associated domain-containing protein n=1 Tax=Luteimonas sp. 8-5 TaxID=3039387 RepID=UPI00243678B7
MSQQTTIRKLAELVNTPVDKLLEQLAEAGMRFDGPDQVVTSIEKVKLLGFLKRAHGKAGKAAEDIAVPKKITLSRSRKQEITVGGGKNRSTVDVVVRKKVTLVKPTEGAAEPVAAPSAQPDDERAEILRKLEESRQRNLSEQQRLAEADQRRAEEAAARKRAEEEAA